MPTRRLACVAIVIGVVSSLAAPAAREGANQDADAALRERARTSLRKAVECYRTKVATEGGSHFAYAEDLSYGRSEMSEGPTRVEVQRDGTPLVGMAYLEAYAATRDTYYLDAARREFTAARNSAPGSLKRPDKLHGLSPWSETPAGDGAAAGRGGDPRELPSRVRAAIDAMDARGAWIEDGIIGKANRLVSVLAAGDLIVTVGGKTIPVKENETVEVFAGPEPPRQRIIRSSTFAENVGLLSAYLGARPQ
jgi:hypothetical protein